MTVISLNTERYFVNRYAAARQEYYFAQTHYAEIVAECHPLQHQAQYTAARERVDEAHRIMLRAHTLKHFG